MIDTEHYNDDFSPKKCPKCGGAEFKEVIKDSLEGMILEYSVVCKECSSLIGHWAHGYFDPCFSDLTGTI